MWPVKPNKESRVLSQSGKSMWGVHGDVHNASSIMSGNAEAKVTVEGPTGYALYFIFGVFHE